MEMNLLQVARRKPLTATVGVMSVGLDTYWEQFPGLLERMRAKSVRLCEKLCANQVVVRDFGMIDRAEKAYAALPEIEAAQPDVLFVDMVTYATSATFAAIVRKLTVPVVLVALHPMNLAHREPRQKRRE